MGVVLQFSYLPSRNEEVISFIEKKEVLIKHLSELDTVLGRREIAAKQISTIHQLLI